MKLDMHCHTHEGSPDAAISIIEYIALLREQGFDGMVVTDHDSYNGYRYYRDHLQNEIGDFRVFRGVEYDTSDAGHMLIIMPSHVKLKVLEHRGLQLSALIRLVHHYGGIIGPAHPYGARFQSLYNTRRYHNDMSIIEKMDFIEGYNPCESEEANESALELARRYNKPVTGGSDSHKPECVGHAYTILDREVTTEDELIECILSGGCTECGGYAYNGTLKEQMGSFSALLVYSFFPYNKMTSLLHLRRRRRELRKLSLML